MPGRPKRAEDLKRLAEEPELVALITERLEEGKQIARICVETGIGKAALMDWLEAPERKDLALRSRSRAATVFAQETVEIADEVDTENALEIHKAKLRVMTRQWIAERWDRNTYGQKPQELTVNLNVLHLDALRHRTSQPQLVEDVTPREVLPMIESKREQET